MIFVSKSTHFTTMRFGSGSVRVRFGFGAFGSGSGSVRPNQKILVRSLTKNDQHNEKPIFSYPDIV